MVVLTIWGGGYEGWWSLVGKEYVCIWLLVTSSGKNWLRPVRLVFCQSSIFWNHDRPKTSPWLQSLMVLGISSLRQSWSSPVSVFFQSWDWLPSTRKTWMRGGWPLGGKERNNTIRIGRNGCHHGNKRSIIITCVLEFQWGSTWDVEWFRNILLLWPPMNQAAQQNRQPTPWNR